jgi:5'-3' exonuclease
MWSKATRTMYADWRDRYYEGELVGTDIERMCEQYCVGLQWILDYYTGQAPISMEWMYPWDHPPLWSDLLRYAEKQSSLPQPPVATGWTLQPQQQLAMVLPEESWWLVRAPELKVLVAKNPLFWPKTFEFSSLGKRWFWECYPRIPILNCANLHRLIRS